MTRFDYVGKTQPTEELVMNEAPDNWSVLIRPTSDGQAVDLTNIELPGITREEAFRLASQAVVIMRGHITIAVIDDGE